MWCSKNKRSLLDRCRLPWPMVETISKDIHRFDELGHEGDRPRKGRKITVKTPANRQIISKRVKQKPNVSIRKIARETQMKRETVRQMLRNIQFTDTIWSAEASGSSDIVEHRQNPKSVMIWGAN
ncbi:hypothetical protein ACLKA7_001348 [Drosophila subpalustris]